MADLAVLTAALTGPIATKDDNPHLPISPQEIASEAVATHAAGAAVAHIHLRDEQGRPTADLAVARRILELIEDSGSEVLVQLSTGVGLTVPYEERMQIVEARPAMATLNVATMTFASGEFRNPPDGMRRLAARMRELGVKPELEIYDHGHLDIALGLLDEDLLRPPLQFSIVLGVYGGAAATPRNLVALVDRLPADAAWQVIGIGRSNLAMTAMGLAMGGNARTGMEDTLMVRRGEPATGNAPLVQRLAAVARAIERQPATAAQAAQLLGITDHT
jgi:uncharacterized protein (DUF849 family)